MTDLPSDELFLKKELIILEGMLIYRFKKLLADRQISKHTIVVLSISIIEEYSRKFKVSADTKLELSWKLLEYIFEYMIVNKHLSPEDLIKIQYDLRDKEDFKFIVESYIDIGNNPNLVSSSQWEERTCCCPCIKRRKLCCFPWLK